jgi:hypothetical protein
MVSGCYASWSFSIAVRGLAKVDWNGEPPLQGSNNHGRFFTSGSIGQGGVV